MPTTLDRHISIDYIIHSAITDYSYSDVCRIHCKLTITVVFIFGHKYNLLNLLMQK